MCISMVIIPRFRPGTTITPSPDKIKKVYKDMNMIFKSERFKCNKRAAISETKARLISEQV